jgi:heme/copper-type cytochrome/quinol oxidase subunit 2
MGEFMLWVALPSVLLATMCSFENLSIPGRAQRAIDGQEMSHEPIEIIATGRHFQWFFHYPGPDGISGTGDDFEIARRLIFPPKRDITLRLKSEDYIYSFILVELGLIEIAVPDMTHTLTFQIPASGRFSIPVDSLCSFRPLHADTMGTMIVSKEAWQRLPVQ